MQSLFAALSMLLVTASLQQPAESSRSPQAPAFNIRTIRSTERPGRGAVGIVWQRAFCVACPAISVPAVALVAGSAPIAARFSARAWLDGPLTPVVVYAVVLDQRVPTGETETPIATFFLTVGQQVEIIETEKWGAEHVIVSGIPLSELR